MEVSPEGESEAHRLGWIFPSRQLGQPWRLHGPLKFRVGIIQRVVDERTRETRETIDRAREIELVHLLCFVHRVSRKLINPVRLRFLVTNSTE